MTATHTLKNIPLPIARFFLLYRKQQQKKNPILSLNIGRVYWYYGNGGRRVYGVETLDGLSLFDNSNQMTLQEYEEETAKLTRELYPWNFPEMKP